MPFLSQSQQDAPPCLFIHGQHGNGKTTRAFQGGKPFGIILELKAKNMIRKINPAADGYFPTSLEDLEKLLVFLGTDKFLNAGFDRIILDSYTELTNALPNWLILKHSPNLQLDPGRLVEKQEYGPIKGWATAIVKAIQLTNLPSFILCRSEIKDGVMTPMSTGSSAKGLAAQVNATFEATYDNELGYIWTSEPHDLSYRCPLPWVPQKWNGSAQELLNLCATGDGIAPTPTPGAPPPVPQDARAQGLAKPAETLGQVVENVAQAAKEAASQVSQAAADFVDKMDPEIVNNEEAREIIDLCMTYKIPQDKLINYLLAKGGMNLKGWKDRPSFLCMTKKGHAGIFPILCDENRRRAFVAHLVNGSYDAPPSATAAPAPMAATA
jgi:hypothetical protein